MLAGETGTDSATRPLGVDSSKVADVLILDLMLGLHRRKPTA